MSIKDYIKERWMLLTFAVSAIIFGSAVVFFSDSGLKTNSDFRYAVIGVELLFLVFIILDYLVVNHRIRRVDKMVAGESVDEDFFYPLDKQYIKKISEVVYDYNQYRAQVAEESADELDFITKWIHDVKVPIAAMHLILEQGHEGMEEQLDMQLTYIEQKTQTVLYHIKSNSFYDDFKIVEVKASRLIHAALKPFAVFFACKQLVLEMPDEDGTVLTDEKWSAYILSQLISNAVKYVPEKGKVSIGVKRDKSQTKVTIKNQGGGIKPQEIAHVFDKGYTSYYARADNKATGYGLYLAKKLADQLGHTLVCTSEYGDYTVFTLTFLRD